MLVNYTLLLSVAIVVGLALAWFSFRFFMKRKKYVTGGFVGFFVGVIPAMGIVMMNSRAYVVTGKNEYTQYAVYGSPEYKMSNGKTIPVVVPMQKYIIINDSPEEMVIEKVVYGYTGSGGRDVLIHAYESHVLLNGGSIDHFFDEKPPRQIESENSRAVVHNWLRTRKDYEKDNPYSIESDKLEKLKEKLKKIREEKAEEEESEEDGNEETE